jgi:hypothetical protein
MAPTRIVRSLALAAALLVWAGAIVSGAFVMFGYASTPGLDARAPLQWPHPSLLQREEDTFTLLFFAHPHCPCTNASFEQLLRILAAARLRVDCHAIFSIPENTDEDWEMGSLLRKVESVSQIHIRHDHFATETRRFGIATSGHVLLYAPDGRLLFSGGITASRGHEGDNAGTQTLIEYLKGMDPSCDRMPVFGCPLFDDGQPGALPCCPEVME